MRERTFEPGNVHSILVVRLYFVGDVLLSTPVIEALARRFPRAEVVVLVKRRARDVLLHNPHVDEILEYDACARYHSPLWLGRLALGLRRRRFSLAVDLTGDLRSSWLLYVADPAFRVGFNHAGLEFLLDRRIPYRSDGHVVEHLLSAVAPLGACLDDPVPKLYLTSEERRAAERLLVELGVGPTEQYVVLSPGANWWFRRWPVDRFGEIARLVGERLGYRCVVTGSSADVAVARETVRASGGAAVSAAGRTSLREFAALAAGAVAFVGNDSGPMHVAASQGTPVVALFGPNTPIRFAPRGAPCRVIWPAASCSPCRQKRCLRPDDPCMWEIGVDEVYTALESLIEETRPT